VVGLKNRDRRPFNDAVAEGLSSGLNVTWAGLFLNVVLAGIKLWGGIVGRSQALVADAVHSVSDLFSDVIVLLGLRWGRKAADEDHPYGHGRIETIATLLVGFFLLVVSLGIAYNAILSIYHHRISDPSLLALIIAAISIIAKEAMYWWTVMVGRRINSMALQANAWHHRSDALSSVAVLAGVGAAYINPGWRLADSFAALVVSFFILRVAASLSWAAFKELADTMPEDEVLAEIDKVARSINGVRNVHDIKARRSGPNLLVELHVVVDKNITVLQGHAIAKDVEACLLSREIGIRRIITHVDPDTSKDRESTEHN
jgi:cation diffusion facilitator family transporter